MAASVSPIPSWTSSSTGSSRDSGASVRCGKRSKALTDRLSGTRDIHSIAVFFRDLNGGGWFGINQNEKFAPASLMKVPVMLVWLKQAEQTPGILDMKLQFFEENKMPLVQHLKPRETIEVGKWYTVRDLLRRMLVFSDNHAQGLLLSRIPPSAFTQLLNDLSVDFDLTGPDDQVSVKSYSVFFRVLYNATYVGRALSEFGLQLLLHEDFPLGIVAGIPQGTKLASKFGERRIQDEGHDTLQLHEFGIVYHPRRPFVLGVMTRGSDNEKLADAIRQIAAAVYREVDRLPED